MIISPDCCSSDRGSMPQQKGVVLYKNVIWSEVQQYYELTTSGQPERCFRRGDESAWHSWLDEHAAFAFVGKSGRISVLKEARSRGAGYWYAYRTQARHTRKQ